MPEQTQTATIIDLLSEGPIEGIVGEDAGVYLNGTPIVDSEDREIFGSIPGTATGSGTTIDFDATSGFDLTNLNLTQGSRYITVFDNITDAGAYIVDRRHPRSLISTAITWTADHVGRTVILEDRTGGGSETFTIVQFVNANRVLLSAPSVGPFGSGNTRRVNVSETRLITGITDSNTITIDSAFTGTMSTSTAIILPINSRTADSTVGLQNFESVRTTFRNGELNQPIFQPSFGGGQTSFATKFNEEIRQTTRSGTYSVSGADAVVKTATSDLGIASPENIDRLKLNFQFPSMIVYSRSGTEYSGGVEFQIFFEYNRAGSWFNSDGTPANTSTAIPVYGVSDEGIQLRDPVNIDDSTPEEQRVSKYALTSTARVFREGNSSSGLVRKRSKTEFVHELGIDIERYKPFIDFRVRIKRVTAVNTPIRDDSQAQTESYLQGIFAYSNDVLNYAYSAVAGIKVDSSDFDSIPQRAYLTRGLKIQVPTNYIPATESSTGIAKYTRNVTTGADTGAETRWDGKFRGDITDPSWRSDAGDVNYRKVYCNNPAWVYYDIMVNDRYGLGDYVSAQDINKYDLYRISRYCDELVPDGKGGTEPRFSCNVYLNTRQQAYKVITDLASVFRSIVKWTAGEISASQDAPKAPVYTFSNSNVMGGAFGYESTSKRLRVNQVGVTWNSPEKFYKQDVAYVEDGESIIEESRIIKKEVVAVGCTSEGQATRLGKWILLTERLETELVKFRTGINGSFVRPGDIIYVQDYHKSNVVASGRLAKSNNHTTSTVYLDRPIPLEIDDYQLHLIFPVGSAYLQQDSVTINSITYASGDQITEGYLAGSPSNLITIDSKEDASNVIDDSGDAVQLQWSEYVSVESRDFSSGSEGSVSSINVGSPAFTSVPNSEVMFTLTNVSDVNTAKGARKYRVLNISENEDKSLDISGHLYLEDKFGAIDRGYTIEVPEFTPLPSFDNQRVPIPSNVSISITRTASETTDESDSTLSTYTAELAWGYPRVEGSDENYPYVDYFEIRHPFTPDGAYEITRGNRDTGYSFSEFVNPIDPYVLVRTVNVFGRRSAWEPTRAIGTSGPPASNQELLSFLGLYAGGYVDTSLSVDAGDGTVSFADSAFTIISPRGTNISLSSVSSLSQGSPAIGSGEYFYIVFDSSVSPQGFKLLEIDTDTVAEDFSGSPTTYLNYQYWVESGQGDFSLVGTTSEDIDTIDYTDGSPGVTVLTNTFTTTADYSSSFSYNDVIRLGSGATAWYGRVSEVTATSITTIESISKDFASGANIYNQDFQIDNTFDFIIGRVLNNGGTHELQTFASTRGVPGADGAAGSSGLDAQAVSLESDRYVIAYDSSGTASDTSSITLTATPTNFEASPVVQYRFLENGVEIQAWSTTPTYVVTSGNFPGSGVEDTYTVQAGTGGSPVEATDSITLVGLQEGGSALNGVYDNSAHTVPVTNLGVETWTGSGGTLQVFEGATLLTLDSNTQTAGPTYPGTNSRYLLDITPSAGDTLTEPTITGSGTTTATLGVWAGDLTTATVYDLDIYIRNSVGQQVQITQKISLSPSFEGDDGAAGGPGADGADGADAFSATGSNENHTFRTDETGIISDFSSFSCSFTVFEGATAYSYDATSPYTANTYRYGTLTDVNVTSSVDGSGVITITGGTLASDRTVTTGSTSVPIIDNDTGTTVATKEISFTKVFGVRAGGIFTFEESTSGISAANTALWASDASPAINTAAAQDVAQEVIDNSADGFIRQNDRVTVTDNSADVAGTRIYTGSDTDTVGGITAASFSLLVVENFDGSVIVDGTLSANKITTGTLSSGTITAQTGIEVGSGGYVSSDNKNSYADTDPGFFLGDDGGTYKMYVGGSPEYITWDGSALNVAGTISVSNPAGVRSDINVADGSTNNGSTINTSGNISGAATVVSGGSITVGNILIDTVISGGSITVGNILIDGTNGRIIVND